MRLPPHTLPWAILLPFLLLGSSGCATNPVTGETELSLVSEEGEIAMGRQADEEIVASMGVVEDQEVQAYVSELGEELAAVSERPDLPWTFRVIDDPTVNAFALPGGFIYVTRGMLTHLDSEAQLVGILGHEIGHVTAKHSVNRMSRAQLAQLGLGVGMALLPELRDFGQLAGTGMQLLFLKFSRDDEHQSDRLGVDYMTDLGYEPAELSRVFAMLERKGEESGGALPTWASTHPAPEDRQERILAMADTFPGAERVARAALLERVDGVVFGSDPRRGFFRDGTFHHPELAFRFTVPSGWRGTNHDRAVQLTGPEEEAALVLQAGDSPDSRSAADAFADREGLEVLRRWQEPVNGLPTLWVDFTAATEQGELRGRAAFPVLDGRAYTFYGFAAPAAWDVREGTITSVLESFRRETDPGILSVQPDVVDVVHLDRALAVSDFMGRYRVSVDGPTLTLINQVWDTGRLPRGPVKRVVSG